MLKLSHHLIGTLDVILEVLVVLHSELQIYYCPLNKTGISLQIPYVFLPLLPVFPESRYFSL